MSYNLENAHNATNLVNKAITLIAIDGQPLPTADWIRLKTALLLLKDAAYLLERLIAENEPSQHLTP